MRASLIFILLDHAARRRDFIRTELSLAFGIPNVKLSSAVATHAPTALTVPALFRGRLNRSVLGMFDAQWLSGERTGWAAEVRSNEGKQSETELRPAPSP
jgi:hypothetical protein